MRRRVMAAGAIGSFLVSVCSFPLAILADALPAAKQKALDEVAVLDSEIARMSSALWKFSEIALEERESAEFLAAELEAAGFTIRRGVAAMTTAFVAEWGQGHQDRKSVV